MKCKDCLFWIDSECWNSPDYPDPNLREESSMCMFGVDKTNESRAKEIFKMYPELENIIVSTKERKENV